MAKEKKNQPLFDIEDFDDIVVDGGGPNFDAIEVYSPKTPGGAPVFDGLDECAPQEPGPNSKLMEPLVEGSPQCREIDLREVRRQLEDKVSPGDIPDSRSNINFDLLSPAEEAALDFDKFFQKQAAYFSEYYRDGDFDNPDIVDSLKYYISGKLIELETQYDTQ